MFAGAPMIAPVGGGEDWVLWLMAGVAVVAAGVIYAVAARMKERPEEATKPEERFPKAA